MKKICFAVLFTFCGFTVITAQIFNKERLVNLENFDKRPLTWGYFLGFNTYDFKFNYNQFNGDSQTPVIVEPQTAFNVGLVGDMRLHEHFNLRLEMNKNCKQKRISHENSPAEVFK